MTRVTRPRVGVFGIGLAAYWPQFEGLRERLEGYQRGLEARLARARRRRRLGRARRHARGRARGGRAARGRARRAVMLYTATYATSSQVLPVGAGGEGAGRDPQPAADALARLRGDDDRRVARELLGVLRARARRRVHARARSRTARSPARSLDGDPAWDAIGEWVDAAAAVRSLRAARASASSATPIPGCSTCTPTSRRCTRRRARTSRCSRSTTSSRASRRPTPAAIEREGRRDPRAVRPRRPGRRPDRRRDHARALRLVGARRGRARPARRGLRARRAHLLLPRRSTATSNERVTAGLIVGNSLLTARGIPTSGEGDLKTNVAMFLLDRLGAGGSYTEFYALDFDEDFVLMGHDGPGHVAIADGRPVLRALKLYHGKSGAGLSVEFKVRLGPVTILGVSQTADGRLKLIAAEGESIAGPTFRIGNTNSRIRFAQGPARVHGRLVRGGPDAPRRARRRPPARPDPQGRGPARPRARGRRVTSVRFLGPGHRRLRRERRAPRVGVRGADRHRARRPDRPERPVLLQPDPPPARRRGGGRRLHVGPRPRLGAPRRRLRRSRSTSSSSASDGTTPPTSSTGCSHCNRWSGRFGDPLGEGPLLEIPVNCESYNLAYVPAVLERAGARACRDLGRVLRGGARGRRAHGRRVRGFAPARHRRLAHDVHGLRDPALVVRRRPTSRTAAARSPSPASVQATSDFIAALRDAGPADWPDQRWYELALDFARGRYGLIVDSDHYVAYFEDPATSELVGRIGYALPPPGPTGCGGRTSGRGRS